MCTTYLFVDVSEVGSDLPDQPLLPRRARVPILVTQVLTGAQTESVAWSDDVRSNGMNHFLQLYRQSTPLNK